jgi:hypothetical protein
MLEFPYPAKWIKSRLKRRWELIRHISAFFKLSTVVYLLFVFRRFWPFVKSNTMIRSGSNFRSQGLMSDKCQNMSWELSLTLKR